MEGVEEKQRGARPLEYIDVHALAADHAVGHTSGGQALTDDRRPGGVRGDRPGAFSGSAAVLDQAGVNL